MSGSHLLFVEALFAEYTRITRPLWGAVSSEDKADGSSVTRADRESSAHVVQRLIEYAPDCGVVSEEEGEHYMPGAEWQWVVDPLDGTASFGRGLPVWGIGMGLVRRGEPVAGYLHFPAVHQTFCFERGTALLNGEQFERPTVAFSADTRNIMITAVHDYIDVRRLQGFRLHNLGSNLYHLMMLAAGRCEAIITGPCYAWDLAPALPFTRAMGHVEHFLDGSALVLEDLLSPNYGFPIEQPMLMGPPELVEQLLSRLR
jgi:fructose-1,6-bisphosphatase/inositol monophosphatase family enzyme